MENLNHGEFGPLKPLIFIFWEGGLGGEAPLHLW